MVPTVHPYSLKGSATHELLPFVIPAAHTIYTALLAPVHCPVCGDGGNKGSKANTPRETCVSFAVHCTPLNKNWAQLAPGPESCEH